ncbi:MAG TPA: glycosyltransferase [Verrucomicrobiae bacterium]|nr:glycosyltransferase [Verrucomicrobiae bacterium]
MSAHIPRVSVGLPVYNGERYLRSALDSILGQDYPDFELIISDNASTDATPDICREYAARDARIRYYRNEHNIGARGNYNRVFELARGEFFKWASHDDVLYPSLLRRCLETFADSPADTVLVFSKAEIIDDVGNVKAVSADTVDATLTTPSGRLASLIFFRCYANPLWGLIKAEALRQTRLMGWIESDHVLLAELAMRGRLIEMSEILYQQRRHAGSAIPKHPKRRDLYAWTDPRKGKSAILLPHWVLCDWEYFKAIRHARLSLWQQLLCSSAVLCVPGWRWFLAVTGPVRDRLGLHRKRKATEPGMTPKVQLEPAMTNERQMNVYDAKVTRGGNG